jgi:hypothetical protein
MYVSHCEGANFWLGILTDLQNRGMQDILIARVDGLTGFPDTIQSVFPQTDVHFASSITYGTLCVYRQQTSKGILKDLNSFMPQLQRRRRKQNFII